MNASNYQPPDWLRVWLDHIPRGAALDLGTGHGQLARWLAGKGFEVTALDRDPDRLASLKAGQQSSRIDPIESDLGEYQPEPEFFSLIVASSILHFLHPDELPIVAARLVEALAPGGFLMAEVFTVDDPSYTIRQTELDPIAPNTYLLPDQKGPVHYFAKGELRATFSSLQILSYREDRRLDSGSDYGFRAGASLVARRLIH